MEIKCDVAWVSRLKGQILWVKTWSTDDKMIIEKSVSILKIRQHDI